MGATHVLQCVLELALGDVLSPPVRICARECEGAFIAHCKITTIIIHLVFQQQTKLRIFESSINSKQYKVAVFHDEMCEYLHLSNHVFCYHPAVAARVFVDGR